MPVGKQEMRLAVLSARNTSRNGTGRASTVADEREAHVREVERFGQSLPDGSYGRRNREVIATRETRVANRLRAVERAYRTANEREGAPSPPDFPRAIRSPEHVSDREIELD